MFKRKVFNVLLIGALLCIPAFAQDAGADDVDLKEHKVLRQMSDYLDSLGQFRFHTENSVDILLDTGQKIQRGRSVDVFVRYPNRFRANIKGDIFDQELYYDGKMITLYGKKVNYYATMKVPPTIEAAMDHAEQTFGVVAPLADLMYKNTYDLVIKDVRSSGYVGLSTVMGVECHHLAFRGEETDWQIWVENSKTPFPRKFVITSKWIVGAPQFTALLTKWDAAPQLKDGLFTFVPKETAEKIDFLPAEK